MNIFTPLRKLMRHSIAPRLPGTTYPVPAKKRCGNAIVASPEVTLNMQLLKAGLWDGTAPLRLHLGCGLKPFEGYINVDYPPDKHSVMHALKADVLADISQLVLEPESVSEIRLHHVFEHFDRISALCQVARWATWLGIGGRLIIETPDLEGSAKTFLETKDYATKMAIARHLAGSHESTWAYHLDHWWPQRLENTLQAIGFCVEAAASETWPRPPFLSNAIVVARLEQRLDRQEVKEALHSLLRKSMVNESEEATFQVWRKQLDSQLCGSSTFHLGKSRGV